MTTNFEYYQHETTASSAEKIDKETEQRILRFRQQKLAKLAANLSL